MAEALPSNSGSPKEKDCKETKHSDSESDHEKEKETASKPDGVSQTEEVKVKTTTDGTAIECAICLQPCVHPSKLPCCHVFCFLCVKGVAQQSKRCALCRKEIPADFLDKPNLLSNVEEVDSAVLDDGYQWFYEGRNGWWQYDERTTRELETAYKRNERSCELLIAGFLYVVDFDSMLQLRRSDPSRRRRIKRDLASIPKKGIAGLRMAGNPNSSEATETETVAAESTDEITSDLEGLSLQDAEQEESSDVEQPAESSQNSSVNEPWILTFSSDEDHI